MSGVKSLPLVFAIGFLILLLVVLPAVLQHFGQISSTGVTLPSAALQVLTSLFAVVVSVSFVVVQLSASFFSIRLMAFLLTRWYFWAVMVIYPATILYSAVLLRLDAGCYDPLMLDALLGLVGFDVILLLPYSVLFLTEMNPANSRVLDFLGRGVSSNNVLRVIRQQVEIVEYRSDESPNLLQPINDVYFSAIARHDTDTASGCVRKLGALYEAVLWRTCPMQRDALWRALPSEWSIAHYFAGYGFKGYAIAATEHLTADVVDQLTRTLFRLISVVVEQALRAQQANRNREFSRCWDEVESLGGCLAFLNTVTRKQSEILGSALKRQQAYLTKARDCMLTAFGRAPLEISKLATEIEEELEAEA